MSTVLIRGETLKRLKLLAALEATTLPKIVASAVEAYAPVVLERHGIRMVDAAAAVAAPGPEPDVDDVLRDLG